VVLHMTTVLRVDGICCPAEVPLIRRLLEPLPVCHIGERQRAGQADARGA
jgi:hypothetical protein